MQLVSYYPVLLEGDRLLLREFQPSDLVDVHVYAGDPFVTRYMTWAPNTLEETRAFLEQVMRLAREEPRMTYELAVTLRDTGELIGAPACVCTVWSTVTVTSATSCVGTVGGGATPPRPHACCFTSGSTG